MRVKSVRKKWKPQAFAAGVDRSLIQKGAETLGLIEDTVNGMCEVAGEMGLQKTPVPEGGVTATALLSCPDRHICHPSPVWNQHR